MTDPLARVAPTGGTDVAVYLRGAPWSRVLLQGSSLELHASYDGRTWMVVLRTDIGEATPIVSRALHALVAP